MKRFYAEFFVFYTNDKTNTMEKKRFEWFGIMVFAFILSACSSGGGDVPVPAPQPPPVEKKIPIKLNCGLSSRVSDSSYENNDKVGLYVVNYKDGSVGTLLASGNHADNVAFTYSGSSWTSGSSLYWKDDKTKADFYVYYPYGSVTDVTAHPFSVKEDQSSVTSYKASEFLYGVSKGVSPTENAVNVTTYHSMSCAVIKLIAGEGFTDSALAAEEISVSLNGLKTASMVNLQKGEVMASGDAKQMIPLEEDGTYKALVIPQTISADNFISIVIDGREYKLAEESFTFVSGKRHSFSVTVSKVSNGVNVSVGAWDEDEEDHGGTAM
jgi:hypothetical protein